MKILGTGLTGLVGSRITELLKDNFQFENISISSGVDITKRDAVLDAVSKASAQVILHLAAKTDVDGCEKEKELGQESDAWKINVGGAQNIVDACLKAKKRLIYISTDFIFDGKKEYYLENDLPNPINWYGKTKFEAEKIIQNSSCSWTILRISYPYRASFSKNDFLRGMLQCLSRGQELYALTDHIFTPTFIDDIALAINFFIKNKNEGIFNVVGSQSLTPYEAASYIAKTFGLDLSLIKKTTRKEFFKNRATRPFCLRLKNDKIQKLGLKMKSFEEGVEEVKRQID